MYISFCATTLISFNLLYAFELSCLVWSEHFQEVKFFQCRDQSEQCDDFRNSHHQDASYCVDLVKRSR